MAGLLFSGQEVAMIVLPLMLYHLIQLMLCAALAQRAAVRA
jgi:sodium/bile acid cotransporter 7